jgi:hypothetical protein
MHGRTPWTELVLHRPRPALLISATVCAALSSAQASASSRAELGPSSRREPEPGGGPAGARPRGGRRGASGGLRIGAQAYWQEAARREAALVLLCIQVGGEQGGRLRRVEARRRWPPCVERGRRVASSRRDFTRRGDSGAGTGHGRIEFRDTRVAGLIRTQQTYPEFVKIIKNRILRRYVSMAYPTRIRIRNVSDTRYGCFLKYPCFVDFNRFMSNSLLFSTSPERHIHMKTLLSFFPVRYLTMEPVKYCGEGEFTDSMIV